MKGHQVLLWIEDRFDQECLADSRLSALDRHLGFRSFLIVCSPHFYPVPLRLLIWLLLLSETHWNLRIWTAIASWIDHLCAPILFCCLLLQHLAHLSSHSPQDWTNSPVCFALSPEESAFAPVQPNSPREWCSTRTSSHQFSSTCEATAAARWCDWVIDWKPQCAWRRFWSKRLPSKRLRVLGWRCSRSCLPALFFCIAYWCQSILRAYSLDRRNHGGWLQEASFLHLTGSFAMTGIENLKNGLIWTWSEKSRRVCGLGDLHNLPAGFRAPSSLMSWND